MTAASPAAAARSDSRPLNRQPLDRPALNRQPTRGRAGEEQLKAWMIAGLDGSAAAHHALLRALTPLLRAFYDRRMQGSGDVEDLVQETLIAVHERRHSFDRARPFTAWLFSIARYKMVDHFRRNRRLQPIEGFEHLLVAEGFEDGSNAGMDVERMLAALPAKQARVVRGTKLLGLSVAQAAARFGLGESDVKVSVHRALKALNTRFAKAG